MGRKILLVTTDQQRYDTLGCNGGTLARTPVVDGLAASGIRYERAIPQSVVCMPSRSTILTGQHPTTHGVWMNGVPLPVDAPSVAELLHGAGYRTALIGKSHFEPYFDPFMRFTENALARYRHHAARRHPPRLRAPRARDARSDGAAPLSQMAAGGASRGGGRLLCGRRRRPAGERGGRRRHGAPQVKVNPIPREWYHTDWVADRTIAWLDSLDADDDWFCWMSFPDPHHPWDPPQSEVGRIDWRDVPLPAGYPESAAERERILDAKPRHWRLWYDGTLVSNYEAPAKWVPATLTADQVREVNARNAVECELIDEALGRVLAAIAARGWDDDVDVIFTTDHGELQGDFGCCSRARITSTPHATPLIWRPAPAARVTRSVVTTPVGLVDLAPTFCAIAGIDPPEWMQGASFPIDDTGGRDGVLTEWDSELFGVDVHLRTVTRDRWVCTAYRPGTVHDGTEGELYDLVDDPLQQHNRWDDPVAALAARRPARRPVGQPAARPRRRLQLQAPV